ncbi:hypothetical protein ACFWAR_36435 [Streptomyces sp. NPDC059917]|uniref:hypothetical protein n=1 Tax=Streptomyces sp. NPDC059917 TaxID=3347002 RepID=UPI003647F22A
MAMNGPGESRPGTSADDHDVVLACGRDLADLWDDEDQNPSPLVVGTAAPHPAACPHCAAALEDFARLRDAVVHDQQAAGPDWEESASRLTASIMDVVRLELRPGRTLALGEMDEDAWIYEAVAARTFRAAAELLPGVRAGSCRVDPGPAPRPGARTPAHVRIEVTVGMTRHLQHVADQIRERIAEAAEQSLGMRIASIDVTVTDLHHEAPGEDQP